MALSPDSAAPSLVYYTEVTDRQVAWDSPLLLRSRALSRTEPGVGETTSFGVRSHGQRQNSSNYFPTSTFTSRNGVGATALARAAFSNLSHRKAWIPSSLPSHNGSPSSRAHTLPAAGGTKQLCHGVAAEGRDMCRAVGRGDVAILTEVLSIIFNTGQRESRHAEGGCVKVLLTRAGGVLLTRLLAWTRSGPLR